MEGGGGGEEVEERGGGGGEERERGEEEQIYLTYTCERVTVSTWCVCGFALAEPTGSS